MNVTCDKCNKRYSIADDKVRGKSVKIRCKQCQNLISVQGPAVAAGATATAPVTLTAAAPSAVAISGSPGAADPWGEERTRAMPAMDLNVQWFAMVKGKQIGPLDLKGMEAKVKAGEVSLRTYLWRQGMADWKRAADVPEVSSVFAGVSVAPTQQHPPPPPLSKKPIAGRDVALANEMPAPEITSRKNGNGNGNGHHDAATVSEPALSVPAPSGTTSRVQVKSSGSMPAVAKAQTGTQPAVKAQTATQPAVKPQTATQPAVSARTLGVTAPAPAQAVVTEPQPITGPAEGSEAKGLSDLFTDVPQPSEPHLPAVEDAPARDESTQTKTQLDEGKQEQPDDGGSGSSESPQGDSAPVDPFAALGPADPSQAPPPGESTNFFIAQAGVNKRNPPWKIALFVGIPLVLVVGGAYVLQMTHLVPMEVTRTNENGEEVKESFFSAGGVSALKDLLSGKAKAEREAADRKRAEASERRKKAAVAEREKKEEEKLDDAPKSNKPPDAALQALYGNTDKNDVGPRVKKNNTEGDAKAPVAASGKWAESANKVVNDHLKSFQLCVEEALHRNPNIKVGKVTLTLTIGTSGAVKDVKLDKFQGTDLGGCIQSRAKGLVFPGPEEPLDLEVPLTLGVTQGG